MVEHLQSGDQTMASEDLAGQAMPHFCEIGCITDETRDFPCIAVLIRDSESAPPRLDKP